LGNSSKGKSEEEEDHPQIPPSPPSTPPSSPSSSSSSSKSNEKKNVHKNKHEMPLLKLDVKFELPIYDGEVNAKNLITGSGRWRYTAVCNRSRMRPHKSSWHL
jgi:hypothetical protein